MEIEREDIVIQLFVKAPLKGKVKTRLIPALGEMEVLKLYEAMLEYMIALLCKPRYCKVELWVALDSEHEFIQRMAKQYACTVYAQQGESLGERMQYAVASGLESKQRVVLVGGDCLSVDLPYIKNAVALLDCEGGAVIGPAEDGGYVLLAVTKLEEAMFEGIEWGSSGVLKQTLKKCVQQNYVCQLLDMRWDLDRPEDLQRLVGIPELKRFSGINRRI